MNNDAKTVADILKMQLDAAVTELENAEACAYLEHWHGPDEKQAARDKLVADSIKSGKCPFGMLKEGQTIGHCPLGFPGCGCGDELMVNPYLTDGTYKELDNQK